ncbi:AcrR family transcriptional regulator [Sphingomonas naasensis]|uniref:TetR/AcrR family transcriptional regulator n=1 Tax=Sphingomonas naasensis TaxID=1344951 RepID=A0A4V3QW77_9SPHN|nr:TetR/AcrR family transcriptional regulator [Sphingomonas naasensis]NIJ21562.1 AcrR family transcriptional regulator [Sphingomonas naasensis]TGX41492.1 TetR/AcrR family transcriptional regulator [Sphingomonas naasensis]
MPGGSGADATPQRLDGDAASAGKEPRTARGRKTLRAILDAAAVEFGEKGFHEGSISGITRRAGVALGSFYTYFDSKDDVFRALVRDMSEQVREHVAPALKDAPGQIAAEKAALLAFIRFARTHKEIYRIIDEAEFVDPESFRMHYATTADRIAKRLRAAADRGEVRDDVSEVHAWAIMGMNVFLGLRYSVWQEDVAPEAIAETVATMLARGIGVEPD